MAETRKFSVHASIIYNLVVAQAGTLAKAVMECCTNSYDAGATKVAIKVDNEKISIVDDGQGFRSREEIEKFFEVFGFPHEEGDRVYGQFGIGRGQLWSFCTTTWLTNQFSMDVDIKRRGLDYDLKEGQKPVKGVTILGTFYEKMLTADVAAFERELSELARYFQIPITVNGKKINKSPEKEKWDFETDDAWIRLTEHGSLAVYNLGMLVRRYSSYTVGSGGVVVTKPGVRLKVNFARNDLLVAECPVWKRIKPFLQQKSDERIRTKKARLTETELENLAYRFLAGDVTYETIEEIRLVGDILGRNHTISALLRHTGERTPLTVAPDGSRLGEQAHKSKQAFVLSTETLARFGVETVKAFRDQLADALGDSSYRQYWASQLKRTKAFEKVEQACPMLREGYLVLPPKEVTPEERMAVEAIDQMKHWVASHLHKAGHLSSGTYQRRIEVGVSDSAEAWTDGSTRIVIERKQLELVKKGIGGFQALATLLAHEFLHDQNSAGTHIHDIKFYQAFHDCTCGSPGVMEQAVARGFAEYCRQIRRSKTKKAPRTLGLHLTMLEKAMRFDENEEPVADEPPSETT